MRNFRLDLCYDGSRWAGWQKQKNTDNTIQQKLETLLSRMLDQPVELAASGRTDAGVHARRQVCSFHAETELPADIMLTELRKYLPEDIGALALEEAPPRFHARLSCVEKCYVYRIHTGDAPCVFERKYVWAFPAALDLKAMKRAGRALCGTHDFEAFCTARGKKKSTVRTLKSVDFVREGDELRIFFTGDGFLYNMVRILTGTLLEVGSGQRPAEDVPEILASRERARAGFTAPARGLTLWDVRY